MLNKLIDYIDSNEKRPWIIQESKLDWRRGWFDYKKGTPPCCSKEYKDYHRGYNSAKQNTEYKLSYIERMVDKFVTYIKGE